MSRRILVGRFGAPHGVRGEVRLQSFTGDPKAIAGYGALAAPDGRLFVMTAVRPVKDDLLVVRVAGINDRTAAERLTHLDLFVDRAALPPPSADEFYVADLVGLDAVDGAGTLLGKVIDVPNYGGGDLLEIRPPAGGETQLFPFTKDVVPDLDFTAGRITIVPLEEIDGDAPPETESQPA